MRFRPTTLPTRDSDQEHITPDLFFDHDGFSPMTHLPLASNSGMATPYSIEGSLADDSPSVLIEADTGRRVPHWMDLDHRTDQDGLEGRPTGVC